jgi:hypothetical protein
MGYIFISWGAVTHTQGEVYCDGEEKQERHVGDWMLQCGMLGGWHKVLRDARSSLSNRAHCGREVSIVCVCIHA